MFGKYLCFHCNVQPHRHCKLLVATPANSERERRIPQVHVKCHGSVLEYFKGN